VIVPVRRFALKAEVRPGLWVAPATAQVVHPGVVASGNSPGRVRLPVMKIVIRSLAFAFLVCLLTAANVTAQTPTPPKPGTIEELIDKVEIGFGNRQLADYDGQHLFRGRIRFVIEHSLVEDNDPHHFEIRTFRTFAAAQRWLQSRETPNEGYPPVPFPSLRSLLQCRRGVCTYDLDGGIDHNHLYLTKIFYGMRNRRPYLKSIYLLDGD